MINWQLPQLYVHGKNNQFSDNDYHPSHLARNNPLMFTGFQKSLLNSLACVGSVGASMALVQKFLAWVKKYGVDRKFGVSGVGGVGP